MPDLKITVTIDETDQLVLKNELIDIDEWVQKAVIGKKSKCWIRFQQTWIDNLMNDVSYTSKIPSNKDDFVALVTNRENYKDRAARDAEKD